MRLFLLGEPGMVAFPNYHIAFWPDPPDTAPTYLCLLCATTSPIVADIKAHMVAVHGVDPLPTPMAASDPTPVLSPPE
jgi:hypothetical protein